MSTEKGTTSETKPPPPVDDSDLLTLQLGVYSVTLKTQKSKWNPKRRIQDTFSGLPVLKRFALEIYNLEPVLFAMFVLAKIWSGVESAILLYLSSQILTIIETGLVSGQLDATAVWRAVSLRVTCLAGVAVVDWWNSRALRLLKTRVEGHFEVYLMKAKLRFDLPTSQEPRSKLRVSASSAWRAFDNIASFFRAALTTASQLILIMETSRSSGDPLFALSCLVKPLLSAFRQRDIWWIPHVVQANNPHYQRMQALHNMTTDMYRGDVLASDIGGYIVEEYEKANILRGSASDEDVEVQYQREPTPISDIMGQLLGDLPMIYCAIMAVTQPSRFKVSSIAILQQSSHTLRWSLESLLQDSDRFRRQLTTLKNLYAVSKIVNVIGDGTRPYPDATEEKSKGMAFELRNVSFKYPGSKSKSNTLNNVSLSIKAGQLITIVGENGSSKSTLIKLLTRMYDASSGEVLLDGHNISEYRIADLRQAVATLTQDHNLFPLPLTQNIGLGNVSMMNDKALIARASELGGAASCIAKLEEGEETTLDPVTYMYSMNVMEDPEDPLQKMMENTRKKIEVSGGERQRMVAARTFMRFTSDKIRFVAVDEPSSALDPEGEAKLFENLRGERNGKTMLFVTHRFGHLTKYADQIIVMKDGGVAEVGTHEELLTKKGEYYKLYTIQASAFLP